MAITGIDTIEGKQIIAAGAVSAKSAEMAYNDENGNPITGYQVAGDYYSASNPSGFITGVPADTMNESAFGYDASNNITGYNGSAFKAGDEFPQSATEAIETVTANSADWNGTTETVSSNSGAWGGSALPISAGPGVKVNLVDNTLVFSNDETVLWSGARTRNGSLSDSPFNYDTIKVYFDLGHGTETTGRSEEVLQASLHGTTTNNRVNFFYSKGMDNAWWTFLQVNFTPTTFSAVRSKSINIGPFNSTATTMTGSINSDEDISSITKIVGINRIAGV